MWLICHIPPPLIDGWWKNGHHLEGGMSPAKYQNFHLLVLIIILSQLIVPFSQTYSAVFEKADHPNSIGSGWIWASFCFGRKRWSSSEICKIQFSSGGLFKTKEPFWNFVCLLPWFNKWAEILSNDTFIKWLQNWRRGVGSAKRTRSHIIIKWSLYCWRRYKKAAGLIQQRV